MGEPFGFLNINKPLGLSSHDVVNRVRRVFNTRQVGHAGTLDPLASGVLIVCVGAATRLSDYAMHQEKQYRAMVQFGTATTTYDAEGAITAQADASGLSRATVEAALGQFLGDIMQAPPAYSAIKIDGRKLYDRARAGEIVEAPPRRVHISSLSLTAWDQASGSGPRATLDVRCGAGTYIRSLAFDLGAAVQLPAHLAGLVRTASGGFTLEEAVPLEALAASNTPADHLIAARAGLPHLPALQMSEADELALRQGRTVGAREDVEPGTIALAFALNDQLIAVITARPDGLWQPSKVFPVHDEP